MVGGKITPVKYYGSSFDRRQAVRNSPRIHEQMTDKKRCGLRSVPPLFRVFANGVHAAPQEWRRHYKEAALLYGRVAGRFTWSVNARSLRSLALGSVVSLRSPPSAFRSLRSFSALLRLPWLLSARPPCRRSTSVSQFRSLRSFVSPFHSENKSGIFEKKERSRRTHIFHENGIFGFCSASAPQKHNSQKSTLHNTQLCDIFYPSAFGYGKCHITCVMYKPLRLWLRGSTFLLRRSDQSTAFAGVRLFSA